MTTYSKSWRKTWFTVDAGTAVRESATNSTQDRIVQSHQVLWALKNRLTTPGIGAWTVVASSGKAGGGALVASTDDNWVEWEDTVWNSSDTGDRSWIVLKSPDRRAGSFYLIIDYVGTDEYRARFYFTKDVPDISSPVINARPPVTGNEWVHNDTYICFSSSADSGGFARSICVRATDGSFHFAVTDPLSNSGEYGHFYCAQYNFNVFSNPKPWDTVGAMSWIWTNLWDHLIWNNVAGGYSLHQDGSQCILYFIYFKAYFSGFLEHSHTDPWTGEWYSEPTWLVSIDSGKKCIRGCLEDVSWASLGLMDGMLVFANEVVKAMRVGPFLIPFDQVGGMP